MSGFQKRLFLSGTLFTLLTILLGIGVPTLALANEIWVEPSNRAANKAIGNLAAANIGGQTHFAFHIPDDYDAANENSHAVIVLLPETDATFDYIVRRNVARTGPTAHDDARGHRCPECGRHGGAADRAGYFHPVTHADALRLCDGEPGIAHQQGQHPSGGAAVSIRRA